MGQEAVQLDSFAAEVAGCIDAHGLLRPGGCAVVGVSGGADSVALLDVLRRLAAQPGREYRLRVAHLDHALRVESKADAAFVAELAQGWGLPFVSERRQVAAAAAEARISIEAAAREIRYAFLADVAQAAAADCIAVAHHADDNVETILHRIVRGTHLRGLAGMPIKRPVDPGRPELMLVRPLLHCRRSEIEAYCHRVGLAWRTDSTNADTTYRRNFIRRELLPRLRRLNPQADEAVLRLADAAAEVEAFLTDQAERVLAEAALRVDARRAALDAAVLAGQHLLLRRCALRAVLERLGAPMQAVDSRALTALAAVLDLPPPAAADLPGGYRARREGSRLVVEAEPVDEGWPDEIELNCPGSTRLPDGRHVICKTFPLDRDVLAAHLADPQPGLEWLDAETVHGRLVCRRRRDGDAFVPLGSPGTQSVSDFLTNLKLPAHERRGVLCILNDAGLVYLAPYRLADHVKITPHTTRVLRIEIHQAEANGPSTVRGALLS